MQSIAAIFGTHGRKLKKWIDQKQKLEEASKAKKALNHGGEPLITSMQVEPLEYVKEQWVMNLQVSYTSIMAITLNINEEFKNLEFLKKYHIVHWFMQWGGIVLQMRTSHAQKHPDLMADKATTWRLYIQPVVLAPRCHQTYILNLDETLFILHGAILHSHASMREHNWDQVHRLLYNPCYSRIDCGS